MEIQGCCAVSEAGICDLGACLQKCFIHNAAAGLPGLLARFLHVSPGKGKE